MSIKLIKNIGNLNLENNFFKKGFLFLFLKKKLQFDAAFFLKKKMITIGIIAGVIIIIVIIIVVVLIMQFRK